MEFIASAYAADAAAPATSGLIGLLPMLLIFAVFYFLLIRPQQKKLKEHQTLISSLNRGDKVVTSGGILGTIKKVEESQDVFEVEIAQDVVVKVKRGTISEIISRRGEPANDDSKDDNKTAKKQSKV